MEQHLGLPKLPVASAPSTQIVSLNEKMKEIELMEKESIKEYLKTLPSQKIQTSRSLNYCSSAPKIDTKPQMNIKSLLAAKKVASKVAVTWKKHKASYEFTHHFDMMRNLHLKIVQDHYQLQKKLDIMRLHEAEWKHDKFQFLRDFKDFKAMLHDNAMTIQRLKDQNTELRKYSLKMQSEITSLNKQKSDLIVRDKEMSKKLRILDGSSEELFGYSYKKLRRLRTHLEKNLAAVKERLKKCEHCKVTYKDIAFTCGHKVLCTNCAQKIKNCPVCQKPIDLRNSITIADDYNN